MLGYIGETRNDAQPQNSTRGRGAQGGQAAPLLLARLSASPTQRKEVVGETSALTGVGAGGIFYLRRLPQMAHETKKGRTAPATNPTKVPASPARRDPT